MNERMEDYGDHRIKKEMIDGGIYLMASPSGEHRDVQGNLLSIFNAYFKQAKKRCRARIDHELYIDEKNTLEPDIKILCRENKNSDIPVIVAEVLSKSTRDRDLGIKMEKYAEIGVREYWIITWETFSIDIYALNENRRYKFCKSYVFYTSEDELKRLDDKEKTEIIKEFSPVSFPELIIQLSDVFDIFE